MTLDSNYVTNGTTVAPSKPPAPLGAPLAPTPPPDDPGDPSHRLAALSITHDDPQRRMTTIRRDFGEFGGVNPSIEASVTFTVLDADTLPQIFQGKLNPDEGGCYLYSRSFSPSVRALARQLAALEGTESAYACASGMAAISASLLALCSTGDAIIASNTVYGGTHALLKDFLPQKCGITTTFVDITDIDAVSAALAAAGPRARVVYTESVANPTLVIADIPALSAVAHAAGAALVVDNTFAPMALSPAVLGADVVVHSLTKFISGCADVVAGAICGRMSFIRSLMDLHSGPLMLLGPVLDPKVASDLGLRLHHLGLRMKEHSRRALAYAERLAALGARVTYPGLPTHPHHTLFKKMANSGEYGFGGLLTIEMESQGAAERFMERLQNDAEFGLMAVSLGYFDTLMSASAASTASELSPTELAGAGISPGLVRLSVGLTGTLEQRLQDLEGAWRWACGSSPATLSPGQLAALKQAKRRPCWPSHAAQNRHSGAAVESLSLKEDGAEAVLDNIQE